MKTLTQDKLRGLLDQCAIVYVLDFRLMNYNVGLLLILLL